MATLLLIFVIDMGDFDYDEVAVCSIFQII
jgi:hypothetical protein